MESVQLNGVGRAKNIAIAVMVIAAASLTISFFLPIASATDAQRQFLASYPGGDEYIEAIGMRPSEAMDISLFEYTRAYGAIGDYISNEYGVSAGIIVGIHVALAIASLMSFLLACLRKPIGASVFAIACAGIYYIISTDLALRVIDYGSAYEWGFAHTVYPIAVVVVVISAVAVIVFKHKEKGAER